MPRILTRRAFLLTGAAAGGTALVAAIGGAGYLATVDVDGLHGGAIDGETATLNAFVTVHADGALDGQRVAVRSWGEGQIPARH